MLPQPRVPLTLGRHDLHDRLGSSPIQTSSTASTTSTRLYDAWGLLTASTGSVLGPFGFAATSGYQEEKDTRLKLLGHRYYDPETGPGERVARDYLSFGTSVI